jgi:small-conductance mechanosensitive channel
VIIRKHWLGALLGVVAAGALATAHADQASPMPRERAEVRISNRPIITLQGPIAGYTARERADATTARIEQALVSESTPSVSMQTIPEGTEVLVGGQRAFVVTPIDIHPEVGETTENVARESAVRLERAITEFAEQHSARYVTLATLWTLLATVIYALCVLGIFRVDRWIAARLAPIAAARTERVSVRGARLLDANAVAALTGRIVRVAAWALALLATCAWLAYSLTRFAATRPWGERMVEALLVRLASLGKGIAEAIPGLVVVFVIFVVARAVVRLAALFFEEVQSGRLSVGGLDADTVAATRWLFNIFVYLFALGLAFPQLPGADTEAFKGLSVLVGLMVSIGASGLAGQGLAGLVLMYSRTIRVGESVTVGDFSGTVTRIGAFTTRIRTGLGEEALLSNMQILQSGARNYSAGVDGSRYAVSTRVTIGYATPWRQVVALLETAARRTPDIATSPAPFVRQTALSDFYVQYCLVAYARAGTAAQRSEVLDRLHANIQDVFNEYGVQIMSPNYEADPPAPQVVPPESWYPAPAAPPPIERKTVVAASVEQ